MTPPSSKSKPNLNSSAYSDLPSEKFWKTGVVQRTRPLDQGLYNRKFQILQEDRISTAGSCFAQHISARLIERNYNVIQGEPPPPGLSAASAKEFGYNIYSARYGNIYTVRQLLQLFKEVVGDGTPGEVVWEKQGKFYDAFRPSVEPNGLDSPEEVLAHRKSHLRHVLRMLKETSLFIFTLGLTETWKLKSDGTVFPTAPGTIAGTYDPSIYEFQNFTASEIYQDLLKVRRRLKRLNPAMRFLLTVSPVPLTATASDSHVLPATIYSKSALRAAAGQLFTEFEDVDYFPSYEIIANPWSRVSYFEPNLRSVTKEGVDTVMEVFFSQHPGLVSPKNSGAAGKTASSSTSDQDDVVCEDALLEAFSQ